MEEVLEKLREFKKNQELNLSGEVKIIDISYYGKINLSGSDADLSNETQEDLYLVKKEVDGKTELEFRTNKGTIATIQENEEIVINNEYKELINTNELLLQMKNIKPISLNKLEQINARRQEKGLDVQNKKSMEEKEHTNTYIENSKDIKIDMNEEITETKTFRDLVPEVKEKGIKDVIVRRIDGVNFEFIGITEDKQEIPLESLKQTEGTNPN